MRIAGDLNYGATQVQNDLQVNALKKTLDVQKQKANDLLAAFTEGIQNIKTDSPLGKNVDFYA